MGVKELQLLCCISLDHPRSGDRSPGGISLAGSRLLPGSSGLSDGSEPTIVAGVLYKWTNYSKGWRSRCFFLKDGTLSYWRMHRPDDMKLLLLNDDVRVIGDIPCLVDAETRNSPHGRRKTAGIVTLKQILSCRESKSDDRRFYIFTATKTLHLRTVSSDNRVAWIQALISTRLVLRSQHADQSQMPVNLLISTKRLRDRLLKDGINEDLVNDCEEIMRLEFSEMQEKLQFLHDERSGLLNMLRQVEAVGNDSEAAGPLAGEYRAAKLEFSGSGNGECSMVESCDDVDAQEHEMSDDDETTFYDTLTEVEDCNVRYGDEESVSSTVASGDRIVERRTKLPDPVEKEKGVSLWSMIKDNVGKDLTRVCLPVYFNEPISSLQKCFEDLEYSYLLDRAYACGQAGDSMMRILNVAAFAVSGYASTVGRHCKPFNPLLGETYEADYPEKGVHFLSEKVSHHPTIIACHCEGRGWKFWGDCNLCTKFWGQSIQLDPVGILTVEFDDGETFEWSKVTTTIYNLILGKIYCDHHGVMHVRGNRGYSCKLKFKEPSILDRNRHQVDGFVETVSGERAASLFGKWDDNMYHAAASGGRRGRDSDLLPNATLLWKSSTSPLLPTRCNLTPFAITLNELTPGLKEKLPPTDSRLRPDQRHLENGEYAQANMEKQRLEKRQRLSKKLQQNGWKPKWFKREGESGPYRYTGGYWEAREQGNWNGCPNIFGHFNEDALKLSSEH